MVIVTVDGYGRGDIFMAKILADGFHLPLVRKNLSWICILVLAPPLIFALIDPQIFYHALNFAGGICTMVLFGLLPIAMVWKGRYQKKHPASYRAFGGKYTLIAALIFSSLVIIFELIRIFS